MQLTTKTVKKLAVVSAQKAIKAGGHAIANASPVLHGLQIAASGLGAVFTLVDTGLLIHHCITCKDTNEVVEKIEEHLEKLNAQTTAIKEFLAACGNPQD